MKNIELKVKAPNLSKIKPVLKKIGAKYVETLKQVDTYYKCNEGRLKTREINNNNFELIFYRRENKKESKISDYEILKMSYPHRQKYKNILNEIFGKVVVVKKERLLWIYKNTRIHLDCVEDLGNFLELETIVSDTLSKAKKEYKEITDYLNISNFKKIASSYSDLLILAKP